MATQPLEQIEGEVVGKYPPAEAGSSRKMDFYVQPENSERLRIAVWETDQVAYSVAQAMEVGDHVTVKVTRNPNKQDPSKFYLNAKDIIMSGRAISTNGAGPQSSDMEDPETWTATKTPKKSHAEKTQGSIENQVSAKGAMDYVIKHGSGVFEEDVYLYDKWFFHQQSRIAEEEIISVSEGTEESPDIAVDEV